MPTIYQNNFEILKKGLDITLLRYNEQLKKSDAFNERARYPLYVMPIVFTILTFLGINPKNGGDVSLWLMIIMCGLFLIICVLFVIITQPQKMPKRSESSTQVFAKTINEVEKIENYYQILISNYEQDYQLLQELNLNKGKCLVLMNIIFAISLFLFSFLLLS